jgi:signal transduction histidine kinase
MQRLINDLLTFARVTSQTREFVEVDLAAIVQLVLSDLENRLTSTHGHVDVGTLPRLQSDTTLMRQLFQNLIGNALKFHREGVPPQVVIRYRPVNADHVEITVADNGIGMEPKYLEQIFAPFKRLHGQSKFEGTGMGLAICRKIVEKLGGKILGQSEPGAGSTFVVTMPRHQHEGRSNHG